MPVSRRLDVKDAFLIGYSLSLDPTKISGLPVDCHWSAWRYRPLVWETKRRDMPARVPPFLSFLSSPYSSVVSFYRVRFSLSLLLSLSPPLVLSPLIALENGAHPFQRSLFVVPLPLAPSLSRACNPFDHLPRRWKVCWFARWPVVSTPLHMVTYHQSTPATRFAPWTPWIFMGRK